MDPYILTNISLSVFSRTYCWPTGRNTEMKAEKLSLAAASYIWLQHTPCVSRLHEIEAPQVGMYNPIWNARLIWKSESEHLKSVCLSSFLPAKRPRRRAWWGRWRVRWVWRWRRRRATAAWFRQSRRAPDSRSSWCCSSSGSAATRSTYKYMY